MGLVVVVDEVIVDDTTIKKDKQSHMTILIRRKTKVTHNFTCFTTSHLVQLRLLNVKYYITAVTIFSFPKPIQVFYLF